MWTVSLELEGPERWNGHSMRILHVMECTIGGTRRHLVDLALGQRALGWDVAVVVSTLRDPSFPSDLDRLREVGVEVFILDMVRHPAPLLDARHLSRIKEILRLFRPAVVHTHSSKAGVLGRQASVSTGIGVRIHTPHTFSFLFEGLFSPPKRWLYRRIEKHFVRHTARFVAVSESEGESFASAGFIPSDKIAVVPNGIDPDRFASAIPLAEEFGLDREGVLVIVVGLIYAAKGQDLAIQALSAEGLGSVQLLIVGPGDPSELKKLSVSMGVSDRVRFLGPREDIPDLMARADLLLLPSRWEGLPYVVLEAFAGGMAVVATPVNGARELVVPGETGYLAGSIDVPGIAAALKRALDEGPDEWGRLGRAGQERVAQNFSIDRMVRGLEAVYQEVL